MKIVGFKPHLMFKGSSVKPANSPCAHDALKKKGYNHNKPKLTFNKK